MKEVEISTHTTVDWKQFFRDVSVEYFINHPEQIGGQGVIVEIDESLFARRKNNVGRIRQMWVMGGYEPARKRVSLWKYNSETPPLSSPLYNNGLHQGALFGATRGLPIGSCPICHKTISTELLTIRSTSLTPTQQDWVDERRAFPSVAR